MRPADVWRLMILAALWGGSFIFMRVGAPALGAVCTAEMRVSVAALCLLGYAWVTRARLELRERWVQYLVIGAVNSAIPFALISGAEVRLTASMAAILNATAPLFGAMVAAVWLKDRLTLKKAVGIFVAILGVSVLVGWTPLKWDSVTILSIGASLLAALCYGIAGAYTKAKVKGAPPLGPAVGSQIGASLVLAPAVPFAFPHAAPPAPAVLCVLALAVFSTAVAYILYFRLIADVGPTKALTVTFLTPMFGVTWGALFLGESVTGIKVLACAIILVGTSLVTGFSLKQTPENAPNRGT